MARVARARRRARGSARVTQATAAGALDARVEQLLERRTLANARFFEDEAERIARLCHRMAERFARGGRLIAFGDSPAARSDVRHVAVEFVHPVIVGKRALPAIGLLAMRTCRSRSLAEPDDIAIAFGAEPRSHAPCASRASAGCLTIAFSSRGCRVGARAAHGRPVRGPGAGRDPLPRAVGAGARLLRASRTARGPQHRLGARCGSVELPVPLPGRARGRPRGRASRTCAGPSLMKAEEVGELRRRRSPRAAPALSAAADALRETFEAGGKLLALGNGGSATDAMDVVADFRSPPEGWPPARGDRPHRGLRDPDRDRERHRGRCDVRAPDHRLRARARRGHRALHERQLPERDRGAGRESRRAACARSRWWATTAAASPPRASPTT